MENLNPLTPVTLQEQLYAELGSKIRHGEYKPGDKLPTEAELSQTYKVSRVTVRAALAQLVNEGALVKRQGKGTFVKSLIHVTDVFSSGSFTATCLAMGTRRTTRILSADYEHVSDRMRGLLGRDDEQAIVVRRIRLMDDEPCIIESDFFPSSYDFVLRQSLVDLSLLDLVREKTGMIPTRFEDQFGIELADVEQARMLRCERGRALLRVLQSVTDSREGVLYVNQQLIVSERYTYAVRSTK